MINPSATIILFPLSRFSTDGEPTEDETEEVETPGQAVNLEPEEGDRSKDQDDFAVDHADATSSRNQNYPNTCGLSIAIDAEVDPSDLLVVTVSYRRYQKVRQHDLNDLQLAHWVEFDQKEICALYAKYFSNIFQVIDQDGNFFIACRRDIDLNDYLYILDYQNLERLVGENIIPLIEELFPNERFFDRNDRDYQGQHFTYHRLFQEAIISRLHSIILDDTDLDARALVLFQWIEWYNRINDINNELKAIYRAPTRTNQPNPVWRSIPRRHTVSLPAPNADKSPLRGVMLIDAESELSLSYQYIYHTNGKLYIKLVLVNGSEIVLRPNENERLNKKDRANELAFFGVELLVQELKRGLLKPYNPPNILTIDNEQNLNKLIYRAFKDFGEGYNTSVDWGSATNGRMFIRTEFLPEQDSPDIDFKPSERTSEGIKDLIDSGVLSMKWLSNLSSASDTQISEGLSDFVTCYGRWIEDQHNSCQALEVEDDRKILSRQVLACKSDYNRLLRNVKLLNRPESMAAFRLMNTAMFMQLHHSSEIVRLKGSSEMPFLPSENTASFYASVEADYKWRSFQLAFILLNLDGFVRPMPGDNTVADVFGTGWPERNELADLVWFPTGGGKTEAYLGIIAFSVAYRRFTRLKGREAYGTTVIMRYTLRLLTLQQFQRATLLICALEVIRKRRFPIHNSYSLGVEPITIGLFVGGGSLPNSWIKMEELLSGIKDHFDGGGTIDALSTALPSNECPWCGGHLFVDAELDNIAPGVDESYKIDDQLSIMCRSVGCAFHAPWVHKDECLPLRLFDEDIYKYPPTLLFGTVDKFAAIANKVVLKSGGINGDSRRLFGCGEKQGHFPPELVIQDELHLLLGPLGSAVGLFEKAVDELCTRTGDDGGLVRPKIVTSTATTRNTDRQIFALFNRRSEIFPKQGINCDDSFFAFYKRKQTDLDQYDSKRRYVGILPVGKTQVWMQLRVASIVLAHRVKYLKEHFNLDDVLECSKSYEKMAEVMDYYHTVLSYFNSLKEVGKTQSQLSHYLPSDVKRVIGNTVGWTIFGQLIKPFGDIDYSELTGRLSGEEVKTSLSAIQRKWSVTTKLQPPEFVIATNMISVGIDVSRFNVMVINSMPRNTAEYIQASSRVARDKQGIVFTVHHPFRSRDLSHYQRFREFHEKFYSYVEPISVTPFAEKALERYFAMFLAALVRHEPGLGLAENQSASLLKDADVGTIRNLVMPYIRTIGENSKKLDDFLRNRSYGVLVSMDGIIDEEEIINIENKLDELLIQRWMDRIRAGATDLKYREKLSEESLFPPSGGKGDHGNWNVKHSLREIAPTVVIKTVQQ